MKVTIDGHELELDEPTTIYFAAQKVGIEVPTMCHRSGYAPFTSCMMCMVEDKNSGGKLPACSAMISDGMVIETDSKSIQSFRRSTLDLLLSDHVGDCEAPCRRGCGVELDIPRMIRETNSGQLREAAATVRRDMAIPAILERTCHAPCETPCRRGKYDEPIAIRSLARHTADWDLAQDEPTLPDIATSTGQSIAIVGAGPTGLAAAYHLAIRGHACTIYEALARPLERVRTEFGDEQLPPDVVDGEVRVLRAMGIEFVFECRIGADTPIMELRDKFDAVLITCGQLPEEELALLGLEVTKKGIKAEKASGQTDTPSVFVAGNVVKANPRVLKSVSSGKDISHYVDCFLLGEKIAAPVDYYDHSMGKLDENEVSAFAAGAADRERQKPDQVDLLGFTMDEAVAEGERCMHCDCREKVACKLRIYSDRYDSTQKHFRGEERERYVHVNQDAGAVYEPGKCIKCGLCVHVTRAEGEDFGFSFVGRGFELKTTIAMGRTLQEGLTRVADLVVEACPTGALSHNEKLDRSRQTNGTVSNAANEQGAATPAADS